MSQRIAAAVALTGMAAVSVLLVLTLVAEFPRGLEVVALIGAAGAAAWQGVRRRGRSRAFMLAVSAVLMVGAVVALLLGGVLVEAAIAVLLVAVTLWVARHAFMVRAALPAVPAPSRPVVVWNPRSGEGRALAVDLPTEARARGIEPIELRPGDDLESLLESAVADGADGLAAAGGDGTQAVVAAVAARHGVPFACIPAGTRNHFALDLGVVRDDVVGALDAFVSGGERLVDLAEVNGRVFVNNASLGLYAEAVRRRGYRAAKIRTLLDTAPEVIGPDPGSQPRILRFRGPDGSRHDGAAVILVSNNRYRLGYALGSGTRPRLDDGVLGVAVLAPRSRERRRWRAPWEQWSTTEFHVESDGPVPVGVDGEATVLQSPVRFRTRPAALRVRIARHHPGASPSAALPSRLSDTVVCLVRIAAGQDPSHLPHLGEGRG